MRYTSVMADLARDDLAALLRWEASGGTWQVAARRPDRVTVVLCRCDGGEEVDRLVSVDPSLIAYLDGRDASGDDAG